MIEEIIITAVVGGIGGYIVGRISNSSTDDNILDKIYKIAQAERLMQATRLGITTEAKIEKDIAK